MLAGCASPAPEPTATTLPPATPTPTASPDPLAGLTVEQRVGQVFMVGTTASGAETATLQAVRDRFVGGIFLSGRARDGAAATAAVVAQFTAVAFPGRPLGVSTDQEGGQVQVLQGPGFSAMPSALEQGAMDAASLQSSATTWARELASAGVTMNLAPVVDLIADSAAAASNPPIGAFDREFGFDAPTIVEHADAFRAGMTAAGVTSVIKHFPGLGAVTANTDDTAGVTDTTTNAQSDSVGIYRSEIASGADTVMVSSAIYSQLDSAAPAVFSPTVVTGLLRDQLGFDGVVITDDLVAGRPRHFGDRGGVRHRARLAHADRCRRDDRRGRGEGVRRSRVRQARGCGGPAGAGVEDRRVAEGSRRHVSSAANCSPRALATTMRRR
jgi:beta-N-acetylhexosaminidase